MNFIEEGAANLDSCCMKELKDRKLAAELLAKLERHDPTRIAVEKRLHALGGDSFTLTSVQRDPGLQERFRRRFTFHESCCEHNQVKCEECDYPSETESNLSDDLDAFMDSYESVREKEKKKEIDKVDEADEVDDEEEDKSYGGRSTSSYKGKTSSNQKKLINNNTNTDTITTTTTTIEELHPDQVNDTLFQRSYVTFLLVHRFDGTSTSDSFVNGLACHLSVLAKTYDLTYFCIVCQPKEIDCRRFGVDRLPSLVCCIDGAIVARATQLTQFRGRDTNGNDIGERLNPWLEKCRMIGRAQRSPESMLLGALYDGESEDDDHDDEDLQVYKCGKSGCCKSFYHTHIDSGMSINAEDLSVL
jgi:hypothetical protein